MPTYSASDIADDQTPTFSGAPRSDGRGKLPSSREAGAIADQHTAQMMGAVNAVNNAGVTGRYSAADLAPAEQQPQPPKTWMDQLTDIPKGFWNNMTESGQGIVDATKAAYHTVTGQPGNLADLGSHIGAAQDAVRLKAEDAFKRGDYAEGVRHVMHYLIPLAGPGIDASGDKAQAGQWGRATGEAISTGAQLAGPKVLEGVRMPVAPKIVNPNPTEAAALDYLQTKGVPVSAGARSGNAFVKNVQKAADSTPLGAVVAQRAQTSTTDALATEADSLANRAHPVPVVPEQAGAGVQSALQKTIAKHADEANTSYGVFQRIEQQTPMPVDVSAIKKQLQPMYEDMQKWWEPAKRNASAGFTAVKSIMDGPDVVPASQAEAGLGGLKALGREADGRNAGIAKFITPKLQQTIDQSVSSVDPHALLELQAGRAATASQYGTKAVLDQLRDEPVQTFGQMTYAKDAGVDVLRQVKQEAPFEMTKIGRAYLQDLFGKAQQQGAWSGADGLFGKWQQLGPETKKMLFPNPDLVSDLDKFFLGAKKIAENPNPSGTALVSFSAGTGALVITNPATGIPLAIGAGALSKMLHSPAGVRALTGGLKIPLRAPAAALAAGQLLKMVGGDVQPVQLPQAAEAQPQAPVPAAAPAASVRPAASVYRPPIPGREESTGLSGLADRLPGALGDRVGRAKVELGEWQRDGVNFMDKLKKAMNLGQNPSI